MYGYPQNNINPQMYQQQFNPQMYQQQQIYQNQNKSQFLVKQVGNIEEAKSFIIDAFSTFLFVDYNNAKIYMKRMNNNGASDFYTFSIEENQVQMDPLAEINKRLASIENKIGGNYELQSISNDEKSNAVNATASNAENATAKPTSISESTGNDAR